MLWPIIIAAVLVIVIILVVRMRGSGENFAELHEGFIKIQKNAFNNIRLEDDSKGVTPPTVDEMNKQSFVTARNFSVFYTISKDDNDQHNHIISGKSLRNAPQKVVIENMLVFMAMLTQQFDKANFGENVKFELDASELGTHYIGFSLTLEQQQVFHTVVLGRSMSQKTKAQCPSCEAAYSIDQAKIPERGAYARCSKCQQRFVVKRDGVLPTQSHQAG